MFFQFWSDIPYKIVDRQQGLKIMLDPNLGWLFSGWI